MQTACIARERKRDDLNVSNRANVTRVNCHILAIVSHTFMNFRVKYNQGSLFCFKKNISEGKSEQKRSTLQKNDERGFALIKPRNTHILRCQVGASPVCFSIDERATAADNVNGRS